MKSDEKTTLRIHIRDLLQSRSGEARHSKSEQICQHLEASAYFKTNEPVLTFASLRGEPDLTQLFNCRKSNQSFCFPRVNGSNLEIRQVTDLSDLAPGYAGIREPSPDKCPLFPVQDLKTILLPGLAYDPSNGGRLGKGKGFYDRLINDLRKNQHPSLITIGVCFNWQLTEVPMEPHDQGVNAILTERGFAFSNKER